MKSRIQYRPDELPVITCASHPGWVDLYNTALRLAFNNIEYPDRDGWKPQMSCMPGSGTIWQWDSCFMALFAKYSNGLLPGTNNLDNLYSLQDDDGYLSMAYKIATGKEAFGQRINPPIYAWVEWENFLLSGDELRLADVLPKLVRYYHWIKNNRRRESGLYWFEDPGSSGMDNSPRGGYLSSERNGSDICFIDLACQQALSALYIEKIALHLGLADTADEFHREYDDLVSLINHHHWCESKGFYFDLFSRIPATARHNFLNQKTVAGFWPMLTGVADERRMGLLLDHLLNPEEFHTLHPVPSLSRDNPNYDPLGGYWLGGVWAPTNYMVVRGLATRKMYDIARDIAVAHISAMSQVLNDEKYASIWECYSPDYIRPSSKYGEGSLVRPAFVGWSGLGPVAMLVENVFGLEFDAANNKITWRICTEGEHGISNLRFNGRNVSLLCRGGLRQIGNTKVVVETSGEINISISISNGSSFKDYMLAPGRHEIVV